jgi:hypothetical protein
MEIFSEAQGPTHAAKSGSGQPGTSSHGFVHPLHESTGGLSRFSAVPGKTGDCPHCAGGGHVPWETGTVPIFPRTRAVHGKKPQHNWGQSPASYRNTLRTGPRVSTGTLGTRGQKRKILKGFVGAVSIFLLTYFRSLFVPPCPRGNSVSGIRAIANHKP